MKATLTHDLFTYYVPNWSIPSSGVMTGSLSYVQAIFMMTVFLIRNCLDLFEDLHISTLRRDICSISPRRQDQALILNNNSVQSYKGVHPTPDLLLIESSRPISDTLSALSCTLQLTVNSAQADFSRTCSTSTTIFAIDQTGLTDLATKANPTIGFRRLNSRHQFLYPQGRR